MTPITKIYLSANQWISFLEKWLAVIFISAIVIIVFAGTVSRYILENPIYGADRLATYLMIWLGFIGFQIGISKMRHIEIEFIKARVKPPVKFKMNMGTSIIGFIFFLLLFLLSMDYLSESKTLGDTDIVLGLPLWQILLILPVTFGISAIRCFFNAFLWWDVLQGRRMEQDIVRKKLI